MKAQEPVRGLANGKLQADGACEDWHPDPLERGLGSLVVSSRAGVVRTWGMATIGRPELVVHDCPAQLVEAAEALLWDLAGWVVSANADLRPGDVVRLIEGEVRLEACDEGLELWERSDGGDFVPGLASVLGGAEMIPRKGSGGGACYKRSRKSSTVR